MKILIAGDGKVGATLTRQLSAEGYDITLIDSDQEVLERSMEQYDVMTVYGNCASMDVLKTADVGEAQLLIAVTSADEVNLLSCLTAHALNPRIHTIARIRNPEYTGQAYSMREAFALSLSINPDRQAAVEIERLIKYPGFLKRSSFAKGRVEIVELRVTEKSALCGLALSSFYKVLSCKVLVCAVLRDGRAIAPDGNFVLQPADKIFVTASADSLTTLLKNLNIITHKAKRVMLAGGGRVSYYLAQDLSRAGYSVQLIEQSEERCRQLASLLPDTCIVHGDASDQTLLDSEGLSDCDVFVSLTGLDELNMILSLCAQSSGVPHVITKIGRFTTSKILDSLPLGSVVSPRELSCSTIVRYVRAMQNKEGAALTIHSIAEGQAEAIEFLVDRNTRHCGEPLKVLNVRKNVLVCCIIRGIQTIIPDGDSFLKERDTVIIVATNEIVIRQLNDIFEE
ncbi:MAG: Trk system potassium transporter TrkA [Eubacteriales bacterium]|nr:Trk system potassium transporter TrkA [Eubacteriales bacterium]